MTNVRRSLTCHHEAGHALARWWLGHLADEAVVLTLDEFRDGVTIPRRRGGEHHAAEGAVNGYDLVEPHMQGQELRLRTEMSFVEIYAGLHAEAYYRHRSVSLCLFEGGAGDLSESARLRREGFLDEGEGQAALIRADSIAKALVRCVRGSAAIHVMADALRECGRIDGREIDAMCSAAYGAPWTFDRWAGAWPPDLAQVRAGYLPCLLDATGVEFIPENGEGPGVRLRKSE